MQVPSTTTKLYFSLLLYLTSSYFRKQSIYRIQKNNRSIFRRSIVETENNHNETDIDWNAIGEVISICSALSGAIVITSNLIIFLLWDVWEIDLLSIFIIIIIFVFYSLREFDSHIKKILSK